MASPVEKRAQGGQPKFLDTSQEAYLGLTSGGSLGEYSEGKHWEADSGKAELTATSAQILLGYIPTCSGTQAEIPASGSAHLQSKSGGPI